MTRSVRLILTLCPLLLISAWVTASSEAVAVLLNGAAANEAAAAANYRAFAVKADEEGLPGAASLFRACGKAEETHQGKILSLLKKRGLAPSEPPPAVEPGTTEENLARVLEAERNERDGFYHDAWEVAKKEGDGEAAALFDHCRTAESEHANLLMTANNRFDSLKDPKPYYVCNGCGFTAEVRLPRCPVCAKGKVVEVR